MNRAPEKQTKETPMENLCPNCMGLRHHSSLTCEKKESVLVTKNIIAKEKPPETVCVNCLVTGHQVGKECYLAKEMCTNCGHSHDLMLLCIQVRLTLEHGGDPLSRARPEINEETPTEDICMNCLDLRHHSRILCEKKERKEAGQGQETMSTPDDPPQLTVPMPMGKTVADETPTPVIERSTPQESPKLSYRDALKKRSVQSQESSKTPADSPQYVTLMPKGKTLRTETQSPLCGKSSTKESPKGSWMKRVRNYVHGIRKKEPP